MKLNECIFSKDNKYRYYLKSIWDETLPTVTFVCLNPSSADEEKDDPTVRRCKQYAKDWGYGGLYMLNAFAYRATDPTDMKKFVRPVGKDNNYWLNKISKETDKVICAWGNHCKHLNRDKELLNIINNKYYLRINKNGTPAHPLYLPKNLKPKKYIY